MPKQQQRTQAPAAFLLTLTLEETARIAEGTATSLAEEPETLAAFLLLCTFLTYTHEDRENYLGAIEKACAPFMSGFTESLRADMADALATVRKREGGAR